MAAHRKVYAELASNHLVIRKFQKFLKYIKADECILSIIEQFDSWAQL